MLVSARELYPGCLAPKPDTRVKRRARIKRAAHAIVRLLRDPSGQRDPYVDGWNAAIEEALSIGLSIGLDDALDTGPYAQLTYALVRRYCRRYREWLLIGRV